MKLEEEIIKTEEKILRGHSPIIVFQAFYPWSNVLYREKREISPEGENAKILEINGLPIAGRESLDKLNSKELESFKKAGFIDPPFDNWFPDTRVPYLFGRFYGFDSFEDERGEGKSDNSITQDELSNELIKYLKKKDPTHYHLKNFPLIDKNFHSVSRSLDGFYGFPNASFVLPLLTNEYVELRTGIFSYFSRKKTQVNV